MPDVRISVRTDIDKLARLLDEHAAKQVPYATARALTETARGASKQMTALLPRIFDRPTPFTQKALRIETARKDKLEAIVGLKDLQARYLRLEETGGTRSPGDNTRKPAKALVLPNTVTRDAYGNIPAGALGRLARMMAAGKRARIKAARPPSHRKNAAPRVKVGRDEGIILLPANAPANKAGEGGYFERLAGHKLRRLTGWTGSTHYRPRFHFHAHVAREAARRFPSEISRWLAEALRTAR